MREVSLLLNSLAAALENVSISNCSDFTSSIISSDASFLTSTNVFPLPGPAGATIYWDSLSDIILFWVLVRFPNISLYLLGLIFICISLSREESKYFLMNLLNSIWK